MRNRYVPLCDAFGNIHLGEVNHYLRRRKLSAQSLCDANSPDRRITHHANVFPLPGVEHLVILHGHVQLPGLHLLQRHVKLEPGAGSRGGRSERRLLGLGVCRRGTKTEVSLVVEVGVDRPFLHVGLLAVPPGLVGQQVQADVRVGAVFTAREQVPASGRVETTSSSSKVKDLVKSLPSLSCQDPIEIYRRRGAARTHTHGSSLFY